MADEIITFVRKKDLRFVRELGQGACGRTIILNDDQIDQAYVCKKYSPVQDSLRAELFENFVREIKILHLLNHPNVVRVFNFYLYPESLAGYILMEFVDGNDIQEYLQNHPEQADQVFSQTIEGFDYLEANGVLHRDVRPKNILVSNAGVTKIIDFGFGKRVESVRDFGKSITLNWWCEPPREFANATYDHRTEVYFVGKLFQTIIRESGIESFSYHPILEKMCEPIPADRLESFQQARAAILSGRLLTIPFSADDLNAYRAFSSEASHAFKKIEKDSKYVSDPSEVLRRLENVYRNVMLETEMASPVPVLNCLVSGTYYFSSRNTIAVSTLQGFVDLLRRCSKEKQQIVLSNLHTRLDVVERYRDTSDDPFPDNDIPF